MSIGPTPGGLLDRTMRTKQISHTPDARDDTVVGLAAKFGGARSVVCVQCSRTTRWSVPSLIYRQKFGVTDKQIEIGQGLAAQAVVAVENTRLLERAGKSLEQPTATSRGSQSHTVVTRRIGTSFPGLCSRTRRAFARPNSERWFRFDGNVLHLAAQFGDAGGICKIPEGARAV